MRFFIVRVMGMLEQVVQKCSGVSILGDNSNPTGHSPEQLTVIGMALSRGAGGGILQKSLPTSAVLRFS